MARDLTEDEIDELIYSARSGDLASLKSLLDELSNELGLSTSDVLLRAVDPYSKSTPLHMACANGHIDVVDYLLSSSDQAIVALKNESGNTPLHWACLNGHRGIVEKLCDSGASPFEKNLAGQDSIFQAENNEKLDIVDYLLERYQDDLDEEEAKKDREDTASTAERVDDTQASTSLSPKLASLELDTSSVNESST